MSLIVSRISDLCLKSTSVSLTKKTKHSKNNFGAQSNGSNLLIKHAIYTRPFRELELVTKSKVVLTLTGLEKFLSAWFLLDLQHEGLQLWTVCLYPQQKSPNSHRLQRALQRSRYQPSNHLSITLLSQDSFNALNGYKYIHFKAASLDWIHLNSKKSINNATQAPLSHFHSYLDTFLGSVR